MKQEIENILSEIITNKHELYYRTDQLYSVFYEKLKRVSQNAYRDGLNDTTDNYTIEDY
jgi:hypothetical protein